MSLSTRLLKVILILVIIPANFLQAQVFKKFSGEVSTYTEELKQFMSVNISKENEEFLENFSLQFNSENTFTGEEKQLIVDISNKLLKAKARPYPHFKEYFVCLKTFKSSNREESDYENWQLGLLNLLDNNSTLRKIETYFTATQNLLTKNILYQSASTEWRASDDFYEFRFNKVLQIVFTDEVDLTCYSKRDSIQVKKTTGFFDPLENIWKGKGGLVTFERCGFDEYDVNATLSSYKIDLSKSEYEADSVKFVNIDFIDQVLTGHLFDKVMQITNIDHAIYPQFKSYANMFVIKNLYDGVDFDGGLLFSGSKIVGTGSETKKANLLFTRADTILLKASSHYFIIKESSVRGLNTNVSIYLGRDSIYHPDLSFNYDAERRSLNLQRTDEITSIAPYNNSYHQVDMDFELLSWKIDEPTILLTMQKGRAQGIAFFKSANFFFDPEYEAMMKMDEQHPLASIWLFRDQKRKRKEMEEEYTAEEFAKFIRKSISQTRHLLMEMASQSFIYFDTKTDIFKIRKKLDTHVNAHMGKIDYDVINFNSYTIAPMDNAILDLQNMDMTINGMDSVVVSSVQSVKIKPRGSKIILKRNRNFQFDGTVEAGLLKFFGENFIFQYDDFKINLQKVDSLLINVIVGYDNFGVPVKREVKSMLRYITGDLYVDNPQNKSGKKDFPEFPMFDSREPSYVYYDQKSIYGGVYRREEFYFMVDPFKIDSLDNFNKGAMNFKGTMHTGGIFPDFRQQLLLQEDLSLGFTEKTPAGGYPAYGKGTFYNDIHLSNKGLHGNGKLQYITSTTYSDDFVFFLDSMNTNAQRFENAKQATGQQYPMVKAETVKIHWLPKKDKMYAWNEKDPFMIINNQNFIDGRLLLEPTGMTGKGKMDLTVAEMRSEEFRYLSNEFFSDTTTFRLRSLKDKSIYTVLTSNVNAHIDYNTKKGTFRSNGDYSLVEFPENQYISYLDYFIWDMNKKEFQMGAEKEYSASRQASYINDSLVGPRYISVNKDQDSLNWVSSKATYDYANNLLKAFEVEYIKVADARIYPYKKDVVVEKDAKMQTLKEAKVLANDSTRYHVFYDSEINVHGRFNYTGKGKHDYIDENRKIWILNFSSIKVENKTTTIAEGGVVDADSFRLSPMYWYQGDIYIRADEKFMTFKGAVNIKTSCERTGSKWLAFKSIINPDSIYIPISSDPTDYDNQPVYTGMMMAHDSIHVYPSFLSGRKTYNDTYISSSSGYLYYNKEKNKYEISSAEKLLNNEVPGSYASLYLHPCTYISEGKVDLGVDLWQFKVKTVGKTTHEFDSAKTQLEVVMALDFFFDNSVLKVMAENLDSLAEDRGRNTTGYNYLKRMNEFLHQENIQGIDMEKVVSDTSGKMPSALVHNLLFDYIPLRWNQSTKSWLSTGKVNLTSVGNKMINLRCTAYLEVKKFRSTDAFDLYLKVDHNNWYYFGYTQGALQTISSYQPYNDAINAIKNSKRKLKVKRGQKPFIYLITNYEKMGRFLKRYDKAMEQMNKKATEDVPAEEMIEEEE